MASRSQWRTAPDGSRAELGTFVHEGREFSSGGALITPEYLACYPSEDGTARSWGGEVLGRYRILSSRPAVFFGHRSWQGERYYYMRVTLTNGATYSVRGFGPGMVARGKAITAQ